MSTRLHSQGETYPVEKIDGDLPADTPLAKRRNSLFMGTNVVSGRAAAIVVHTGRDTEFGRISHHLELRRPETDFERGLRSFGYFLMELTLLLVVAIFAIRSYPYNDFPGKTMASACVLGERMSASSNRTKCPLSC